jgi:hypothetical protein
VANAGKIFHNKTFKRNKCQNWIRYFTCTSDIRHDYFLNNNNFPKVFICLWSSTSQNKHRKKIKLGEKNIASVLFFLLFEKLDLTCIRQSRSCCTPILAKNCKPKPPPPLVHFHPASSCSCLKIKLHPCKNTRLKINSTLQSTENFQPGHKLFTRCMTNHATVYLHVCVKTEDAPAGP